MKTRYIWIMAMAVVALTGCQKERVNGNLELIAEGMNGNTKLAINGLQSYWVAGESVRINNNNYTISVNSEENGRAYVDSDDEVTAPYCGVYPASIYSSNAGTDYVLDLPASYIYATTTFNSQTVQNLASPMVAFADDGATSLYFKHVTAAIGVEITNNFGIDVRVTNITVSSNKYKLNGEVEVAFGESITVNAEEATGEGDAAKRQVVMNFTGTPLEIVSGASATVQVPVLPVGNDNRFTISVTVQNKDDAEMEYTFSKTQANGQSSYTLTRAQIGYAPAKFGGVFTVSSGKQVRFAPGNLLYDKSADKYSFMKHQYDMEEANGSVGTDYSSRTTVSLFNWYGVNPTETSSTAGDYPSPYADWGTTAFGSESGWYTLTKNEWVYLTNGERVNSTTGLEGTSAAKFVKGKVDDVCGLFIFCDNYVHPSDATISYNSPTFNGSSTYVKFTVSSENWKKMEVAGAIFLPVSGNRSGEDVSNVNSYGYYWASDEYNGRGYSLSIGNYGFTPNYNSTPQSNKYNGCSVRLVRDVQ